MSSAAQPAGAARRGDGPECVVLVVEDDVITRMMVSDHLRGCGFAVMNAGNAAEAIALLSSPARIDVLFTDIHMPGDMDGHELAAWAKQRHPQLSVILTSGDAQRTEAAKQLCDNRPMMQKPYLVHEVEKQIRTLLSTRDRTDEDP
jgi:CheY-like chemotaxis protein